MDWLDESLVTMEPVNYDIINDGTELKKNNIFRAILQEFIGSFLYVLFFLTQTEDRSLLSREKGICCLVIASSYVTARACVYGQINAPAGYTTS